MFTIEGIKILSEIIKSDKIKEYSKLILEAFSVKTLWLDLLPP